MAVPATVERLLRQHAIRRRPARLRQPFAPEYIFALARVNRMIC
jgi:hypothetical protein